MALHPEILGQSDLPPIGASYEREHLDFKQHPTGDNYEMAKDVAAFANRTGGVILVGAEEKNDCLVAYHPLPRDVADKTRVAYLTAVKDLCVPGPTCDVHVIPHDSGFLVAANVRPLPDQVVGVKRRNDPDAYTFPQRVHSGTAYLRPTELATVMIPEIRFAALQLDSIPLGERDKILLAWAYPNRSPGTQKCKLIRIEAETARAIFHAEDIRIRPEISLSLKAIAAVNHIGDGNWRIELYGALIPIGQGLVWQPAR
jgi:hypothetical protein